LLCSSSAITICGCSGYKYDYSDGSYQERDHQDPLRLLQCFGLVLGLLYCSPQEHPHLQWTGK
jgi:hypothetical protein